MAALEARVASKVMPQLAFPGSDRVLMHVVRTILGSLGDGKGPNKPLTSLAAAFLAAAAQEMNKSATLDRPERGSEKALRAHRCANGRILTPPGKPRPSSFELPASTKPSLDPYTGEAFLATWKRRRPKMDRPKEKGTWAASMVAHKWGESMKPLRKIRWPPTPSPRRLL